MPGPVISALMIGGIGRSLVAGLGVGVVTYVGLDQVVSQLSGVVTGNLAVVSGIAGLTGLPVAANMILSAFSIRVTMTALKAFKIL